MTGDPVCHVCGVERSIGIGLGFTTPRDKDPRWLCISCAAMIEDIRKVKRMDAYEHRALDKVDDIAGDFAADHGADMAAMDELTRRMLWKAVVQGYGNALREGIRNDAPF